MVSSSLTPVTGIFGYVSGAVLNVGGALTCCSGGIFGDSVSLAVPADCNVMLPG